MTGSILYWTLHKNGPVHENKPLSLSFPFTPSSFQKRHPSPSFWSYVFLAPGVTFPGSCSTRPPVAGVVEVGRRLSEFSHIWGHLFTTPEPVVTTPTLVFLFRNRAWLAVPYRDVRSRYHPGQGHSHSISGPSVVVSVVGTVARCHVTSRPVVVLRESRDSSHGPSLDAGDHPLR